MTNTNVRFNNESKITTKMVNHIVSIGIKKENGL